MIYLIGEAAPGDFPCVVYGGLCSMSQAYGLLLTNVAGSAAPSPCFGKAPFLQNAFQPLCASRIRGYRGGFDLDLISEG